MGDTLDDDQFLARDDSDFEEDDNDSSQDSQVEYLQESGSDGEDKGDNDSSVGKSTEDKKRKRKDKFAELKAKRRKLIEEKKQEEGQQHIVHEHDSEATMQLQPEEMLYLIEDARRRYRLSPEEFASVHFEPTNFFYPAMDVSAVTESATKKLSPFVRALSSSMPNYRKLLSPEGCAKVQSEDFGSPLVVIVTASAIRATEIIQGLHAKIHHCKLAKLFGKHIKITDQIELLSKSYHPIVVGTPHRLHQLAELGALSFNKTQLCLVDFTTNSKSFTILTLAGVNQDFGKLLFQYIHPQRDHIRLALIKDKPSPVEEIKKHAQRNFVNHQNKNKSQQKNNRKKNNNNNNNNKLKKDASQTEK